MATSARDHVTLRQLCVFARARALATEHGVVYPKNQFADLLTDIFKDRGWDARAAKQHVRQAMSDVVTCQLFFGVFFHHSCFPSALNTQYKSKPMIIWVNKKNNCTTARTYTKVSSMI